MSLPDLRIAETAAGIRKLSPVVIVAAVLALVFIAAATLVATLFAPKGHDTAVVTAFVIGTIAPTIVGLMALVRGDHAVQVGERNAQSLAATAATVEQVATDVNGHLQRHDALAEKVADVAQTIASAAGVNVAPPRDPGARTRASDGPAPLATTSTPVPADVPPLSDQS